MTYAEQLKHPKWQKRRLEKMAAADFRCEECESDDATLHIHHRRYIKGRKVWEYSDDLLRCLCDECHGRTHQALEALSDVMSTLSMDEIFYLVGYAKSLNFGAWGVAHSGEKISDFLPVLNEILGFHAGLPNEGWENLVEARMEERRFEDLPTYKNKARAK